MNPFHSGGTVKAFLSQGWRHNRLLVRVVIALVVLAALALIFALCSRHSAKSEREILSDIRAYDDYYSNFNLNIDSIQITKRQTNPEQKVDYVWCTVSASNRDFTCSRDYSLTYVLYNDGWLLDDYDDRLSSLLPNRIHQKTMHAVASASSMVTTILSAKSKEMTFLCPIRLPGRRKINISSRLMKPPWTSYFHLEVAGKPRPRVARLPTLSTFLERGFMRTRSGTIPLILSAWITTGRKTICGGAAKVHLSLCHITSRERIIATIATGQCNGNYQKTVLNMALLILQTFGGRSPAMVFLTKLPFMLGKGQYTARRSRIVLLRNVDSNRRLQFQSDPAIRGMIVATPISKTAKQIKKQG